MSVKFTEIVQTFKLLKDYITLSGVFCSGNAEKNKSIKSYIGSIAGSSIIKMEDLKLYKIEKRFINVGAGECLKVCVNLQNSVWRFLLLQEEKVIHHKKKQ